MTEAKTKKLTPAQAMLEVCRLFVRGMNRDYILEYAKAQKWGLKESAMIAVIEKATEQLIEIAAALNLDTELGHALTNLEDLYKEARAAKDTKTALAVQRERNALLKLSERARHNARGAAPAASAKPAMTGPRRIEIRK